MKRLSAYTTFGIGGEARELYFADGAERLTEFVERGALVLGGGSNVLVSDDGYDGIVCVNRYRDFSLNGETVVAGSGARLSVLSGALAEAGMSGMEWAVGIPGTVGGAVKMNAGAFGSCVGDRLVYADVFRGGRLVRLSNDELCFSYRKSGISDGDVVISAAFIVTAFDVAAVKKRTADIAAMRAAAQPRAKSAGSVFKNPCGMHIAELIEKAGLKGYTVGGARVSEKHANIIVNIGGARASDVCAVIKKIKSELLDRYGVAAQEEIQYIGEFG